jgi:hypothetical protein
MEEQDNVDVCLHLIPMLCIKLMIGKNSVHFRVNFDRFNVHIRNSVGNYPFAC